MSSFSVGTPLFYAVVACIGLCLCLAVAAALRFYCLAVATSRRGAEALEDVKKRHAKDKHKAVAKAVRLKEEEMQRSMSKSGVGLDTSSSAFHVSASSSRNPLHVSPRRAAAAVEEEEEEVRVQPWRHQAEHHAGEERHAGQHTAGPPPEQPEAAEAEPAEAAAEAADPAAAEAAPALPPGWLAVPSRSKGRPFYYHSQHQLKVWQPPDAATIPRLLAARQQVLDSAPSTLHPPASYAGPGWERIYSPDRKAHFFFNVRTHEKVWSAEAAVRSLAASQLALPPKWLGPPLPEGWQAVWSRSKGKFFFSHAASRAKRWQWPVASGAGSAQAEDPELAALAQEAAAEERAAQDAAAEDAAPAQEAAAGAAAAAAGAEGALEPPAEAALPQEPAPEGGAEGVSHIPEPGAAALEAVPELAQGELLREDLSQGEDSVDPPESGDEK